MSTYRDIDQCDASSKVGCWIYLVHQRVLSPIADHERQSKNRKGNQECEQCRSRMQLGHVEQEGVAGHLRQEGSDRQLRSAFPDKIKWEFDPDKQHEPCIVMQKVQRIIALIANR